MLLKFWVCDDLAEPIWRETIRQDKFVGKSGKINKNNLPALALKRQQKSFVMSLRQFKKTIAIVQLIRIKICI